MKLRLIAATLVLGTLVFSVSLPQVEAAGLVPDICEDGASCSSCHFFEMLNNVIVWTADVFTLLFIIVLIAAGFWLVSSTGNERNMTTAKKLVSNGIIGLILILGASILLDITMRLFLNGAVIEGGPWNRVVSCWEQTDPTAVAGTYETVPPGFGGAGSGAKGPDSGTCKVATSGYCSPSELNRLGNGCFGSRIDGMSQICNLESNGGNAGAYSGTDKCKTGDSWSFGLFQINLMAHGPAMGCGTVVTKDSSGAQTALDRELGTCLKYVTNSKGFKYCQVRNCSVPNRAAFNACKAKAVDPSYNVRYACGLYQKSGLQPWSGSAGRCGVR